MKNIVVGITGASGSIYGLRLVDELLRAEHQVAILLTNAGRQVLAFETGLALAETPQECLEQLKEYYQ
ncbi:MAG: aromatic acid decarboxylase, partial [Deltaproteobacteria bacterium]|nr:aromatic acid decarboxylase [Deltaproteobacteria bacterium]